MPKADPRYKSFVHNYFYGPTGIAGNAAQSAINAGFAETTARTKAPGWVKNSQETASNRTIWAMVQSEREKIENDYELSEEEILKQYKRLCTFDIRKLYDPDGNPIPIHELDDDTAAAISGIDVVFSGTGEAFIRTAKIKVSEKKAALDSLAKIKGMFAKDNEQKRPSFEEVFSSLTRVAPELAEAIKERLLKSAGS